MPAIDGRVLLILTNTNEILNLSWQIRPLVFEDYVRRL